MLGTAKNTPVKANKPMPSQLRGVLIQTIRLINKLRLVLFNDSLSLPARDRFLYVPVPMPIRNGIKPRVCPTRNLIRNKDHRPR